MSHAPKPPKAYEEFVKRYPKLGRAWDDLTAAGEEGPLDGDNRRLIKLAIAIGAMREGAVRANARKALAAGVSRAAVDQVIALAASTIGLPSTVAVFTWVRDATAGRKKMGK
jgi:alkylhydroperoxidase/carboxymuconolactone decarboxylase family protein YurZ